MTLLFQCLESVELFLRECMVLKLKEQKLIKVEAPFIDEISGLAIVKILDKTTHSTMIIKLHSYEI